MAILPDELIFDVLSRLPVKDLLRFKCVCKSWLTLITNPRFIKTNLDRSLQSHKLSFIVNSNHQLYHLSFPSFFHKHPNDPITKLDLDSPVEKILGSCNGLLCFLSNISGVILLLNPLTRELKKLLELPFGLICYPFTRCYSPVWGFGFDSNTNEYKVVRIVFFRGGLGSQVLVHTIGSNSWRIITQAPAYFIDPGKTQVLANGNPHWEAAGSDDYDMTIISFDVADEVFDEMPYPDNEDGHLKTDVLGVLRGRLCVLRAFCFCLGHVEVWVMDEYGVKESWNRKLRITHAVVADCVIRTQPFWVLHSSEILVQSYRRRIVYDPNSESVSDVGVLGVEDWFETVGHVESLVKLEGV